ASTALRYLVAVSFANSLPNLLTARGLPLTATGAVVTAFLIAAALGLYAGGAGADRFGNARIAITGLIAAVTMLLLGSVLLAVHNAPVVALAQTLLPRNLGTALGLMNGVAFGIGSLGVALIGGIVTREGAGARLIVAP